MQLIFRHFYKVIFSAFFQIGYRMMKRAKGKENERNYDCLICMDLCKKPISCARCQKLMCHHHLRLLANRCPYCRLEPLEFKNETMIESFIEIEIRKKREELKKDNVFKCLVEGCEFQGKYPTMVFHRKSKHPYQNMDQILFPQERQKKKMREALKRIFLQKYAEQAKKYTQEALVLYIKSRGTVEMKHLTTMVAHIDNCQHEHCKQVLFEAGQAFIGFVQDQVKLESECPRAMEMRVGL